MENAGPIFNQQEMMGLLIKMEEELAKSEERRVRILENIDDEEEKQEDIEENVKMEHNIEDDLKIEIANMFGKILQAHKQDALPFFTKIYQTHIIPCIQNPTKINLEYALYLIDDSIEYIGQFLPEDVLVYYK